MKYKVIKELVEGKCLVSHIFMNEINNTQWMNEGSGIVAVVSRPHDDELSENS